MPVPAVDLGQVDPSIAWSADRTSKAGAFGCLVVDGRAAACPRLVARRFQPFEVRFERTSQAATFA